MLALKAFCDQKPDERKLNLLQQLKQRWNQGKDGSNPKPKKKEVKTRRVMLGWMRYDKKAGRYVRVSLAKGGGTRKVDLPVNYSKNDVIEYAQKVFFPSSEDIQGNFNFDLANFKQTKVDTLTDTDGLKYEFTVGKYFEVSKTHQLNLYLMTKEHCDSDKEEEDVLMSKSETLPVNTTHLSNNSCSTVTSVNTLQSSGRHQQRSSLIGSSSDREMLKSVQDAEYQASLKIDQEKEQNKYVNEVSTAKLKALQAARLQRVPPEPALDDVEQLKIYIRHPSRSLVSRAFRVGEKMLAVYDWCGSLEPVPEHFSLCTSQQHILLPHEPVISAKGIMLYVHIEENPINLSPQDSEVTFKGFGWSGDGIEDDTFPLTDEEMPKNIMEGDHTRYLNCTMYS